MAINDTRKIDPNQTTNLVGPFITRGGYVTLDQPFYVNGVTTGPGEFAKLIHVNGGGTIILENKDDQPIPIVGLISGQWVPGLFKRVLSSAVINGIPTTTDCTGITWSGGN